MKPIFQETTLQFEHDIKTVWDTVVDNSQFKWRSDLEKIDVLDQNTFVEINKKGVATTFFITEKDLYRTYSFDLENDKLKGKWTGTFEKTEKGCSFTLKEEIYVKNPLIKIFAKSYLKTAQQTYAEDLKKRLEEIRDIRLVAQTIGNKVHEMYYDYNLNCAQTTLMCLGSFFHIEISKQVFDAAVGLDGAGRFGAQCGLVEGAIMFLGIYLSQKNFSADEIEKTCSQFASEFKAKFGSLECSKLRPQGFNKNDPPHLCESLTVNAIIFDYSFLKNL